MAHSNFSLDLSLLAQYSFIFQPCVSSFCLSETFVCWAHQLKVRHFRQSSNATVVAWTPGKKALHIRTLTTNNQWLPNRRGLQACHCWHCFAWCQPWSSLQRRQVASSHRSSRRRRRCGRRRDFLERMVNQLGGWLRRADSSWCTLVVRRSSKDSGLITLSIKIRKVIKKIHLPLKSFPNCQFLFSLDPSPIIDLPCLFLLQSRVARWNVRVSCVLWLCCCYAVAATCLPCCCSAVTMLLL